MRERDPIKTKLRIRPAPDEGKRDKFTFWKLRPQRNKTNKITIRRVTNPVKEAGGSTLVGGASVMIIEGY
jgi:hypothetical protein